MRLDNFIPTLDVKDVETSIEFYSNLLGFSTQDRVQWGGKTEWALLRTGRVQLMLCASRDDVNLEPVRGNDGVFFVYLDNIEVLYSLLGARGYDPRPGPSLPASKRLGFYLYDPDGYVLWFRQSAPAEDEPIKVISNSESPRSRRLGTPKIELGAVQ